ncbi:MAG: DUF1553 domain-containing protein [Verrucomicrobia bacterium]|nr:DUF1553 domain-containing protein [Verrucomicrobiota bacterium]
MAASRYILPDALRGVTLLVCVWSGLAGGLAATQTSDREAVHKKEMDHWSFRPPQRPAIPQVKNSKWVRNPIDAFVLARLEKERLKPSPEADRITLIRRLSFDLLGLPPTPQEVAAFVNDKRTDAYERLVGRLLASPHFGERWGRHWLDLARYADSDGYEKDSPRPYAWLYRNWVIDAVNRDLPFDQFTLEQLAGDLFPDATEEQKKATGFHRNTLTNKEGGVDQEEFRNKAVVDRVNTTGSTWLGLTVGCAECHSHKYDPISQREYYQLFAFFNNADEKDLPAPQPEELTKYGADKKVWDEEHAKLVKPLNTYVKNELPAKQAEWENAGKLTAVRWTRLEPKLAVSANGATLKTQTNKSILTAFKNPATDTYTVEVKTDLKDITGFRLETLDDKDPATGPGRAKDGNFILSEFSVKVSEPGNESAAQPIPLQNPSADFSQKNWSVAAAIDGDPQTGWAIIPQTNQPHVAVFETKETLNLTPGAKLSFTLDQQYGSEHTIGDFRLSATSSPRPLKASLISDEIIAIWETPADQRTEKQKAELTRYFREEVDPEARELNKPVLEHTRKEPKFPDTKAQTLAENDKPRKTAIHLRGDFLRPGDQVQPATLAILPPLKPRGEKPDRLDLARWIMDPANPLTARVTVNRIWNHLFGRGLVATLNDFGTRGEKPSHPELLDWLAVTFMSPLNSQPSTLNPQPGCGWSQKEMIKLIVTSATYRQSSNHRPDLLDRDPNNILLARQSRLRLEAENVRDVYLAASGLLNPAIGGPSIRPPLPADIAALGYANSIRWKESDGAEKYRRGMYIFFQRTVPYPMLMTFDAPDSNVTCTRRERSNTPLQALTLLNDPVFFECAQALGKRVAEGSVGTDGRIKRAFELCLSRAPTKAEMNRLMKLYDDQLRLVQSRPESAAKILGANGDASQGDAEKATLVALGRVIMNLDEFVTRN